MLVDRLARSAGVAFAGRDGCAVSAPVAVGSTSIVLAKPQEFMNRSGPPLARLLAETGVPPGRLLVAVDDVHLAAGRIRLRREGSSGGHGGLASIIEVIGPEFPRLRMGVGAPPD